MSISDNIEEIKIHNENIEKEIIKRKNFYDNVETIQKKTMNNFLYLTENNEIL